jgi:hypothetical protein
MKQTCQVKVVVSIVIFLSWNSASFAQSVTNTAAFPGGSNGTYTVPTGYTIITIIAAGGQGVIAAEPAA